jgi:hypothetical protein
MKNGLILESISNKEVCLMNYKDLQLEDFPELNLDPQKFTEWKEAKDNERRNLLLFAAGVLVVLIIIFLATGDFYVPGLLILIFIPWLISRKTNQLGKELGITTKMYADAWKKRKAIL